MPPGEVADSHNGPIRTIVRIKIAILRNGLKSASLRRNTIVALVLTVLVSGFGCYMAVANANASPDLRDRALITSFTLMMVAWLFVPLLPGGIDDTVDPGCLAQFALRPSERRLGVLFASMVGFLPAATTIVLLSVVVSHLGVETPFVVVAVLLHISICLLGGRAVGALLLRAGQSRRGRDIGVLVAALAGASLWAATQSLTFVSEQTFLRVMSVLRNLPSGTSAQAVIEASERNFFAAGIHLLFGAGAVLVLFGVWSWAFDDVGFLGTPARPPGRRSRSRVRRFPRSSSSLPIAQWRVLVGKELRYILRSPQRRTALVVSMVLGGPFLVVQLFRTSSSLRAVYLAPLALVFAFGSINNLLGADAPSLWLEITSGATFRTIVVSRSLASIPYVILPVVAAATALAAVAGFGIHFVTVVALGICGAGIPLAVGCVVSVRVPVPQNDTDDPFSNTRTATGEGCLSGLMAGVAMVVTFVLLLPVVVLRIRLGDSVSESLMLCTLTAIYATSVWALVAGACGRWADTHASELLAALTSRNLVS